MDEASNSAGALRGEPAGPQQNVSEHAIAPSSSLRELLGSQNLAPPVPMGTPLPRKLAIGHLLGDCEIRKLLGQGGSGTVYAAFQHTLSRDVAIKILTSTADAVPDQQLLAEARTAASLKHKRFVIIHALERASVEQLPGGPFYLIMEHLQGETLRTLLRRRKRLWVEEALFLLMEILEGMEYAHRRGIVHRDLKPDNIFITEEAGAKILDLGLAGLLPEVTVAPDAPWLPRLRPGAVGTPSYMAPEVWRGDPAGPFSDVFALGVILFEMLGGRHPFWKPGRPRRANVREICDDRGPPPLREERVDVPPALDAFIARALSRDPGARFGNGGEMLEALRPIFAEIRQRLITAPEGRLPYVGLSSFAEKDALDFFGREIAVRNLMDRLSRQTLITIVAPSAAGKSSLISAGLIPMLRRSGFGWEVRHLRPGHEPVQLLSRQLHDLAPRSANPQELIKEPHLLSRDLIRWATEHQRSILIFMDQCEELYTATTLPAQRQAVLRALLAMAVGSDVELRIILAIRSDYLFRFEEDCPALYRLMLKTYFRVPPLTTSELQESLARPASARGYQFEAGLAENILADLKRSTSPLLHMQFAARRLWEQRCQERKLLLHSVYDRMGGVHGALAAHGEQVLADLPAKGLQLTRQLLTSLCNARGDSVPARMSELLSAFDISQRTAAEDVLNHLIRCGLVAQRGEGAEATIELAHEALATEWRTLVKWLGEHQEDRAYLDRIIVAARTWDQAGRGPGLLWSGRDADRLAIWVQGQEQLQASETALAFIRMTIQTRQRKRRNSRLVASGFSAFFLLTSLVVVYMAHRERVARHREHERYLDEQGARAAALSAQSGERLTALALGIKAVGPKLIAGQPSSIVTLQGLGKATSAAVFETLVTRQSLVHDDLLMDAQFSTDGALLVTASADQTARIWDASSGVLLKTLKGHSERVCWATFSPSGDRVVTASWDNEARLWEVRTGAETARLAGHTGWVQSANFSPDGRRIVTASRDKTARLWDANNGKLIVELQGHARDVMFATFSHDGRRVATASLDNEARIWDADSGQLLATFAGHGDGLMKVDFSPDDTQLVSAGLDRTARLWDLRSGKAAAVLQGHTERVISAVFSPDGRRVLTASSDGTARLWTADSGQPLFVLNGSNNRLTFARFTTDQRYIVTAGWDRTARIWDARDGRQLFTLEGHSNRILAADIALDGGRVVTASEDHAARIWQLVPNRSILALEGHRDRLAAAAFSPDGQKILTGSLDSTARLWDVHTGQPLARMEGHTDELKSVGFSADGASILTAGLDNTARIWDARTGRELRRLLGHSGWILYAKFAPHDNLIVTASADHDARIWDATTGAPLAVLHGHKDSVRWADFSPRGQRVVTASYDGTARVWDTRTGRALATLTGHTRWVMTVAYSPQGKQIATAGLDRTARLFDADTGALLHTLSGHQDRLASASFSPDGQWLVTASMDHTARLWEVATGRLHKILSGHKDDLNGAEFSPDSRLVVTAGQDRSALVWDVMRGEVLLALEGHTKSVEAAMFSPDGRSILTISHDWSARLYPSSLLNMFTTACSILRHQYPFQDSEVSEPCTKVSP